MKTMKRKTRAVVVLVAVIALIAVAACQAPPATPTGPTHVVLDNAYEIGASGDMPASAAGDTNLTNLVASGDVTVGGALTVTGGVTGANVLTTGVQTVAGAKTWSDAAVFSSTVTAAGAIRGRTPVLLKTANYVATAADTGAIIETTNAMTVTLPAVAVGINLCVYNGDGADIKIDPNTTNTVLTLTNGNGDRVTNTTVGDSVCLVGLNTTSWMAMERVGTWSDGN